MKASFFKRILAFIVDYFIVAVFLSIITISFSTDKSITKSANKLIDNYANGEITIDEYNEQAMKINYNLQKSNIPVNMVTAVLFIGYFIIFAYLNKGQTLGKKLFKIKIVEKDKKPSIKAMILRSLFIYGIISSLYSAICINLLSVEYFSYGSSIIGYIESLFIVVSFFMILYKKDGRGLHDLIGNTNVIEEVK